MLNSTLNEEHVASGYVYDMNNYSRLWDDYKDKWGKDKEPRFYDFKCYGRKLMVKNYPELQKELYNKFKNRIYERVDIKFVHKNPKDNIMKPAPDPFKTGKFWVKHYLSEEGDLMFETLSYENHGSTKLNFQSFVVDNTFFLDKGGILEINEGNDHLHYK